MRFFWWPLVVLSVPLIETVAPRWAHAEPGAGGPTPDELVPSQSPEQEETGRSQKKKKPKVKISGVLSVIHKFRLDENDDGAVEPHVFRLGKARVRFKGAVNDYVGYTLEVDPRSPTILGVMRDAYIRVKVIPQHEVRIGQQKTQFGWENRESSTRLYTITRSELSESLGRGVTLRDLGIGLIGKVPLGEAFRFEDAVTLVNGAGFGVQDDDTMMKNLWGRVGVRYENGAAELVLRWGVSGAFGDQMGEADPGPPPVPPERFQFKRLGADFEVDHRWAFLVAEYAAGWDEIPANSGEVEMSSAYYVELVGKTPWNIGPVIRYDAWDAEEFSRLTAGAYWGAPDEPVRCIIHYERFEDEAGRHDGRVLSQAQVRF